MEISWKHMDINNYLPRSLNWFMKLPPSKKDQQQPETTQKRNDTIKVIQKFGCGK